MTYSISKIPCYVLGVLLGPSIDMMLQRHEHGSDVLDFIVSGLCGCLICIAGTFRGGMIYGVFFPGGFVPVGCTCLEVLTRNASDIKERAALWTNREWV